MYCTCMYMYDVHVSINYDKANETPDYQDSSNTVVILHVSLCIKMCSFYDLDAYISQVTNNRGLIISGLTQNHLLEIVMNTSACNPNNTCTPNIFFILSLFHGFLHRVLSRRGEEGNLPTFKSISPHPLPINL